MLVSKILAKGDQSVQLTQKLHSSSQAAGGKYAGNNRNELIQDQINASMRHLSNAQVKLGLQADEAMGELGQKTRQIVLQRELIVKSPIEKRKVVKNLENIQMVCQKVQTEKGEK